MTYKIIITNITSHKFYMASGILPMHKIICDTHNELTGETKTQAELFEPGPEHKWAEIQENGYVLRHEEDKLSTESKPGYHYRHIMCGMVILPGNKMYVIDVPSPVLYDTEAAAKSDNTYCRFIKIKGTVYLCVFGSLEPEQRAARQTRLIPALFHLGGKPEVSLAPETTAPTTQPDDGLDYLTDVVVFQNDHITVTITGAKRDSSGYLTLDIKVENKSSQNLDLNFLDAYINGVHVPTVNNISVGANETVTKDVYFVDTYILGNFIDRYTDIELMFWLGDSDNRLKYQQEGFFHYYPYGKEEATAYKPEDRPSNVTVVETDDFAIIAIGFREEEIVLPQYVVDLYIENKSENNLLFDVLNVKVNSKDCDPLYTDNVAGRHASLSRMDWGMQKLTDAGVEMPVKSIEFKLRVKNLDDFFADPVYDETVTITPPQ